MGHVGHVEGDHARSAHFEELCRQIQVAVDIGGRPFLQFDTNFNRRFCGELDSDLLEDFFQGFAVNLGANVVVRMPYGRSDHHKIEATFKAFAKAMKMACSTDPRALENIPSTKGTL